ncbi:hypothetical protein TVAG_343260 [Trichomonas vaginalis G3]|uniref:Uncharacterized protein n=1 Tax=Trichomonas vaginalis (strain ATCC PRA-98 / G3) TaxID=412133 RepID=A2E1D0_TRIV3|nr:hypothetical protein TVAGG3_0320250 [Trichomonas vaginalis G3]EAY13497.1 hypothetical protein TVAG_343260 [Trichomonas vaginalis G3]KAI5529239.1 hypothetical protein TVAGG3_0320250 [Trichomonas vaginalis G3]|eukprot:XP_001325720.1 hypothetical protein [Trichomonas vaginalis G3]
MSIPASFLCSVSGKEHTIVYRHQNKAEFITYINKELDEIKKTHSHRYYAIHTDRSLTKFGFNDLYVIEIARCFSNINNIKYYQVSTNVLQTDFIDDGFIIIDPDEDVKNAISSLLNSYTIHPVMFDFLHHYTALVTHSIKVNTGDASKNFSFQIFDPQAAHLSSGMEPYILSATLEEVVEEITFKFGTDKKAIQDLPKFDFPKLIYQNQNKNDEEIIDKYIELLPYYASRVALVALSLLQAIYLKGSVINLGAILIKKRDYYLNKNLTDRAAGLLFQKIRLADHYLQNIDDHPYESWLYIHDLLVQENMIKSVSHDFKYLPDLQEYLDYCDEIVQPHKKKTMLVPDSQSTITTSTPFSMQMAQYKVSGTLRKFLTNAYDNMKNDPSITFESGKEFEQVVKEFDNPLLMYCIENISKITDDAKRNAEYLKIAALLNM